VAVPDVEIAVPTKDLQAVREGMLETARQWGAEEQVKIWLNRFGGIALEELEALPDDQFFALMPRFSRRFALGADLVGRSPYR
jgi:hypothetical protein